MNGNIIRGEFNDIVLINIIKIIVDGNLVMRNDGDGHPMVHHLAS